MNKTAKGILVLFFFSMMLNVFLASKIAKLDKSIKSDASFYLDDHEWSCGYTQRQVKINILEEELKKLKQ